MKIKTMHKKSMNNISTLIGLCIALYLAYYLLLCDNILHCSITSFVAHANHNHLSIKKHVMIIGFLPIYIATMIFGAGIAGVYLGKTLETMLARCIVRRYQ